MRLIKQSAQPPPTRLFSALINAFRRVIIHLDMLPYVILGLVALVSLYFVFGRSSGPVLDPVQFREFELLDKIHVSHNTAIYRFFLPRKTDSLGLPIGQHISIKEHLKGRDVICSYTPISTDADKGFFDLLIKAYPQGTMSKHISELKNGDKIKVRGPKGFFKYTPNMVRHLNMVAGGTGITPMYQVIRAIHDNPEDKTTVTLVYGNVSAEDILLRAELEEIAAEDKRIKVYHVLNNPPEGWTQGQGFITKEILESQIEGPKSDNKFLMCGPLPMTSALKKVAVELGWEKPKPVSKAEHQVFCF